MHESDETRSMMRSNLETDSQVGPRALQIINQYPLPIAYPWEQFLKSTALAKKLQALFTTFNNMLAYLALLLFAQYLAVEKNSESLNAVFKALRRAQLSNWMAVLVRGLRELPPSRLVKLLTTWYQTVEEQSRLHVREIVAGKAVHKEVGYLSHLLDLQESAAPMCSVMEAEELQRHIDFYHRILDQVLANLDFLSSFPLYYLQKRLDQESQAGSLMGTHNVLMKLPPLNLPPQLQEGHVFLHDSKEDIILPLYPLLIYQECHHCMRTDTLTPQRELCLYRGHTAQRVYYQGMIHQLALREHLQAYRQVLQRKNILQPGPVIRTVNDLQSFCVNQVQACLAELQACGLVSNFFPRPQAQAQLDNFAADKHYPLFVLVGKRGTGKTALLAEMVRKWSHQHHYVLFYRLFSQRPFDLTVQLRSLVGGQELTALWRLLEEKQQRLFVVLDGLEEAQQADQLLANVGNFAAQHQQHIKLVLSLRDFEYHLWQKPLKARLIFPTTPEEFPFLADRGAYQLENFSLAELPEAYKSFANARSWPLPLTTYEDLPATIQHIIRNPEILVLFLWTFQGKDVPRYIGLRDLMEGFALGRLFTKNRQREIFESLAVRMLSQITKALSLDEIVESEETVLMEEILGNGSNFEEALSQGLLEKSTCILEHGLEDEELIRFPLALVLDYLFYRHLALAGRHVDDSLVELLQERQEQLMILQGALGFALLRLVEKQEYERFATVCRQAGTSHPLVRYLIEDILHLKKASQPSKRETRSVVAQITTALLEHPFAEGVAALLRFSYHLIEQRQYREAVTLLEQLLPHLYLGEQSQEILGHLLLAYCWQCLGEEKKAGRQYKKVAKQLKSHAAPYLRLQLHTFWGQYYVSLADCEKASSNLEQALVLARQTNQPLWETFILDHLGKLEQQAGNYDQALQYHRQQREICARAGLYQGQARACMQIGRLLVLHDEREQAIQNLQQALQLYGQGGYYQQKAHCQKELTRLYEEQGEYAKAYEMLKSTVPAYEATGDKRALADVYLGLSKLTEKLHDDDQMQVWTQKAFTLLRKLRDEHGQAQCYTKFGAFEFTRGNYDKALIQYRKALDIFKKMNDQRGLGNLYNNIGMVYKARGNLEKALRYLERSIQLREQTGEQRGSAHTYNNMAVILAQLRQFEQGFAYLEKASRIFRELHDQKGLATIKSTQGLLYSLQDNNAKALECYAESAEILEIIDDQKALAAVFNSMGLIYKERGDYYRALSYFENGAKIQEELGDLAGLAASYNNIGLIYNSKNEYEKALEYYMKDLDITQKLGDQRGLATSYNNIAILHYNHRHYVRALCFLEKAQKLYRDLGEDELVEQVKERIRYVKDKL